MPCCFTGAVQQASCASSLRPTAALTKMAEQDQARVREMQSVEEMNTKDAPLDQLLAKLGGAIGRHDLSPDGGAGAGEVRHVGVFWGGRAGGCSGATKHAHARPMLTLAWRQGGRCMHAVPHMGFKPCACFAPGLHFKCIRIQVNMRRGVAHGHHGMGWVS